MGIYPNVELTFQALKQKGRSILGLDVNQYEPRQVKDNLIFYKFKKIEAGPFNSALITDKGEVLLQGLNDFGQLGLSKEINSMVPFFPNFVKLDFFVSNKLKVDDVAISAATYSFLAENRLFTMGRGDLGQLGNDSILN